ncbi:MAG TPA: nucleotidyltransferase family protein [Anaerolineales bacterium]|nr:nucleotidyltransferase family protein [Anaerolineales bacterium]
MNISAIILAAGQSKRMGRSKMTLPWENITVLGKVIETIKQAGVGDILVVTGGERAQVETIVAEYKVRTVRNENFESEEMIASIQLGLRVQHAGSAAALICLGDQPQVEDSSVRSICEAFQKNNSLIVVPSYQNRRGHPWLIARELWKEVLGMRAPESMRDFLHKHNNDILYVVQESSNILQDLDTPEDYMKYKPQQ